VKAKKKIVFDHKKRNLSGHQREKWFTVFSEKANLTNQHQCFPHFLEVFCVICPLKTTMYNKLKELPVPGIQEENNKKSRLCSRFSISQMRRIFTFNLGLYYLR
jgi:hypothetical protein